VDKDYRLTEDLPWFEDEHMIDQTTEKWLDVIESRLMYKQWYSGMHFL
jgi:hypothetical protein